MAPEQWYEVVARAAQHANAMAGSSFEAKAREELEWLVKTMQEDVMIEVRCSECDRFINVVSPPAPPCRVLCRDCAKEGK